MADDSPDNVEGSETPGGSSKKLMIVLAITAVVGSGVAFVVMSGEKETPAEKLTRALELIDKRESNWQIHQSLEIIDELAAQQYVDPDFPSAEHYVRGLAEFYTGREFTGKEQQSRYLKAIEHFEQAFPRGMPQERRGEMVWAMGVALQTVSLPTRAREILEASLENYPPGRVEASLLLMQNYLDQQLPSGLDRALALSNGLPELRELTVEESERANLLRAEILEKQGRSVEATAALDQLNAGGNTERRRVIGLARQLMTQGQTLASKKQFKEADKKYKEAQTMLLPLSEDNNHTELAAQASFLNALCSERMNNAQSAINYYQRTARKFAETDEWLASQLRLASLLRAEGRDEEAISAYRQVLRTVTRPEDFRNSWLTVSQFRDAVLIAWNDWLEEKKFDRALALTRVMSPLIERIRALDLTAQTSEQWATSVQTEADIAPFAVRQELRPSVHQRWVDSGKAHAALAAATTTEADYPETVWTSAVHYGRGYAFEEALSQVNEFIRVEPPRGVPRAYVFRGRMLMNLDQLNEAFDSFQYVEMNSPTDPSVFEARYRLGLCQLEMSRPEDAERTWRAMLTSEELKPDANEWRLAKFAVGKLLVRRASNWYHNSLPTEDAEATPEQLTLRKDAYDQWREAVLHLDEYLKRYPESAERIAARYLLAKSLQSSAQEIREKLTESMPDNARKELFRELTLTLDRSGDEYRALQQLLQELRVSEQLDDYGQELYRTTFMAIPQTQFEQERYADALIGFRTVISRFSDHIAALPAYIQMARCYTRLEKPDEARRQLEQARVILGRLPDEAFGSPSTGQTREQWREWIEWAREVHDRQYQQITDNS